MRTLLLAADETAKPDSATAWLVLGFGILTLVIVYYYLHRWRKTWQTMAADVLSRSGRLPGIKLVQTEITVQGVSSTVTIRGPGTVIVGQPSQPFIATIGDQLVSVEWQIDGDGAELSPSTGSQTVVTARSPGAFAVHAEKAGSAKSKPIYVAAIESAPGSLGDLPLVGAGFGGITIAILAVSVAGALTAIGLLPGAALATLLGTVVSYFFVQSLPRTSATNKDQVD